MIDVMNSLASIKSTYELAKSLKAGIDKIDDVQMQMQMAKLVQELAEATVDASEKATRIYELERQLNEKMNLIYEPPYYRLKRKDGSIVGPFCQTCYDSEQKIIRLQEGGTGIWRCFTCDHTFYDGDYVPSKSNIADIAEGWDR